MTRINDFAIGHAVSILYDADLADADYHTQYEELRSVFDRATDLELCSLLDAARDDITRAAMAQE